MSTLLVLTPLQARTADPQARGAAAVIDARGDAVWAWAWSEDDLQISNQGESPPAQWPRADRLVVVVPPHAMAWAVIDLPKVGAARLRAALDGALEEMLLEEPQGLHYALPASARPGRRTVVAVMQRGPLEQALLAVQGAGREVDRVVPAFPPTLPPAFSPATPQVLAQATAGPVPRTDAAPGIPPEPLQDTQSAATGGACTAHFQEAPGHRSQAVELVWSDEEGVAVLPLAGDGARSLLQQATATPIRWTSTPAAAVAAEAWCGRALPLVHPAQPWLAAAESGWELRQFDLAPRHRGWRWSKDAWRQFIGPAWRPVRWGGAALLAVQVVGLQAWAWQQQQAVEARKQAQVALLKTTHPQVRVVLDAPLQMQRETERLRQAAGQPGESDLEAALSAAATAWPADLAPPQTLRYERGELTLAVPGLSVAQGHEMGARLQPLGWALAASGGRVTLTRQRAAVQRSAAP